jgi:hypothetical protein
MFKGPPARGGFLGFLKRKEEFFVRMRYNHTVVTLPGTSSFCWGWKADLGRV